MVCTYRLVMISIDLSKTTFDKKSTLEIQDKIQSNTKSEKFFFQQNFFLIKNLFPTKKKKKKKKKKSWILSWIEFVSDYIPQLYFACNYFIRLVNLRSLAKKVMT